MTRYVLLELHEHWRSRLGKSRSLVCRAESEIRDAIPKVDRHSLWISPRSGMTDKLLRQVIRYYAAHRGHRLQLGNILMLESPRPQALPILRACFAEVVGETPCFRTLPAEQLAEVLSSPDDQARDVFIGGVADVESGVLALVRGNLDRVIVPLSVFRPSATTAPSFDSFELDDYGHTIRFGEYEAAADLVLYETDPEYRRRVRARRRESEKGFGPALRRLRIQRGLSRSSFAGVSAKSIARLERGEIAKPQSRTLRIIAKTLGVDPQELETY